MRVRYSIRSLVRDPVFIALTVLVLSLGVAANTTVFAVIDQVVLNPLPYRNLARLVMVWESNPSIGEPAGSRVPAAWTNFAEWQVQAHSFEYMEAFEQEDYSITGLNRPEHVVGVRATSGYFRMLGVEARRGRTFAVGDTQPGADPVALVTEAFSVEQYGSDDSVGKKISLNGAPYTIVGVLPASFHLPAIFQGSHEIKPAIWVPLTRPTANEPMSSLKARELFVTARLNRNVSMDQARQDMRALASRLATVDPQLNAGYGINIVPLRVENADPDLDRALYLLWLSAFLVLLLGCTNLAGLTFVRSMKRKRDLAIMKSLGASRTELISIVLIETCLLASVSAVLALVCSYSGIALIRALRPADLLGAERLTISSQSLLFAGLTFVFCIVIFGVLPAWFATRLSRRAAVSFSSARVTRSGEVARRGLVCAEVAIALFVSISAILLIRSFRQILRVDPGFRPQNVLTARIALGSPQYADLDGQRRFCDAFLIRLRQIPTTQSASLVDNFPLYSIRYTYFEIEGRPEPEASKLPTSDYANVTSQFFETMGTPLLRGRLFNETDMQERAEKVAIVNQSLAEKFWPNQDPIGSYVRYVIPHNKPGPWRRVVGIVGDFRQFNIETPPRPEMFWASDEYSVMTLVVRSTSNPKAAFQNVRQALAGLDKEQPLSDTQTLQQMVDESVSQRRFNAYLLGAFAGLSIILALVGIYGLISYIVSSRNRDIAIRLALGAQHGHVLRMCLSMILPFAAIGLVLGIAISVSLKSAVGSVLFGISALDPLTFMATPAVLALLILFTCLRPAMRAARIHPARTLRQE